jgi:predicted NAD/FAD-dependent oxidoreductase
MNSPSPEIAVVGAGIAGASVAYRLSELGLKSRVYEAEGHPGGRMASAVIDHASFDHGAQFFTTRGREFRHVVDAAAADGAVKVWTHGFGEPPDGYERWRGVPDMTALAAWLLSEADVTVHFDQRVDDLKRLNASAIVLTPPVPVSLALAQDSNFEPPKKLLTRLRSVEYKRTIAVLFSLEEHPRGVPIHGGMQFVDDPELAFIADNATKGVSVAPAVTVHLSNDASLALWNEPDHELTEFAYKHLEAKIGAVFSLASVVKRWRYAGPVQVLEESAFLWGDRPLIAMAGEAFNGPKVEGAFNSGRHVAEKIAELLS